MNPIRVPEEFLASLAESEAEVCRRVRRCDPLEAARRSAANCRYPLELIETYAPDKPVGRSRILEVGSGNGFFLCYALVNGLDVVGVEPGRTAGFEGRHARAAALLRANGVSATEAFLRDATAERLPFEDGRFDVVVCVTVLEHVRDVDAAVREALRVLKPGGVFIADVPNYHSWYEGHYDIPWIPGLGKRMSKRYVSVVHGRDPSLIDELHFTVPAMFAKFLRSPAASGRLFYHGRGLTSAVFDACNFLTLGRTARPGRRGRVRRLVLRLVEVRLLRRLLHAVLLTAGALLARLGAARSFVLVLRAEEGRGR